MTTQRWQVDIDIWATALAEPAVWSDGATTRTIFYADTSRTISAYTDDTLTTPVPIYDVSGNEISQPTAINAVAGKQVWINYSTRAYFLLSDGSSFEVTSPDYPSASLSRATVNGAIADGTTGCSAAITDTLATAQVAVLPPSSTQYKLDASITIPAGKRLDITGAKLLLATGVTITLGGAGASLVGDMVTSVITLTDDTNQVIIAASDAVIKGMKFSSTYTSAALVTTRTIESVGGYARPHVRDIHFDGGSGFLFNGLTDLDIDNILYTKYLRRGGPFYMYSCTGGVISRVRMIGLVSVADAVYNFIRYLLISTCSKLDLYGCEVRGCDASAAAPFLGTGGGISLYASDHITVTGCSGRDNIACEGGVLENNCADITIVGGDYTGNGNSVGATAPVDAGHPYQNGDGWDLFNSTKIRLVGVNCRNNGNYGGIGNFSKHIALEIDGCDDVVVEGVDASDAGAHGIGITGCTNVQLLGVRASRCGWSGLNLQQSSGGTVQSDVMVDGGIFNDNAALAVGSFPTDSGVAIGHGSTFQLSHVTATDTRAGGSRTQTYGIRIENTATGTITFGKVGNNVTANILDSVGTTKKRDITGYVTSASGATSVADGGTINHGLATTPTRVSVTPSVASQMASVTAKGATTFTVALKTDAGAAGTTQTVYWEAEV